jgi:alpha-beta hydrolase superfamily lysophospholipase
MARLEELRVTAGDATLAGTLTLPDEPPPADRRGRYPNVLLLPSWLPRNRDGSWDRAGHPTWFASAPDPAPRPGLLARLAAALAGLGVASLRCDPRGCGASDGAWEEVGLFTRIDDARDQLAAMRSHGSLDLRRTGLVGHGEGALLAMSVAIGDPAVGALTLIGPSARPWQDVLRRGAAARARHGTDLEHPIVAALGRWSDEMLERAARTQRHLDLVLAGTDRVRLSLAGVEQAMRTPPLALATMLHRPATIAHGADDRWSHPDDSRLLADALAAGGETPRRDLLAGAGHDLAEADDATIAGLAADLAARLVPRDLPPVLLAIEEG